MNLWTARITYAGSDRLDITVKNTAVGSLGWLLAPSWALVGGHKLSVALAANNRTEIQRWKAYQPLSHDQYTERFYQIVREKYRTHPAAFLELIRQDRSLCCFCQKDVFCHRHLAADIVMKIALTHGIDCRFHGER